MSDIQIKINPETDEIEGRKGEYVFKLNARKTLEDNIVVRDHPDIDIVIMPASRKVVAFPKENMCEEVYQTQHKFFDFLMKRGVIITDSVQGGNVYGSLEAKIPTNEDINAPKMTLMVVAKFIESEKPYFEYLEAFEDMQEERFTKPNEDESSEYDPERHAQTKGSMRPMYIRNPYGISYAYRE